MISTALTKVPVESEPEPEPEAVPEPEPEPEPGPEPGPEQRANVAVAAPELELELDSDRLSHLSDFDMLLEKAAELLAAATSQADPSDARAYYQGSLGVFEAALACELQLVLPLL